MTKRVEMVEVERRGAARRVYEAQGTRHEARGQRRVKRNKQLRVLCLTLLIGLGRSRGQPEDLPSELEIESSINRTIEEVERQVRENSTLPRLTRQQIVRILQNVTSRDLNDFKDKQKLERARSLYQRALMVVLPYSANDSSADLTDLYAKPPVTRIIAAVTSATDSGKPGRENGLRRTSSDEPFQIVTENLISKSDESSEPTPDRSAATKLRYKNHRDTYSEVRTKVPLKETLKLDSTPVRFTFNLENLRKNAYADEKTTTARYPIYRSGESNGSQLEVVYGTSVTAANRPATLPTAKQPASALDSEKPKPSQNVLASSEWRYNAPPTASVQPTFPSALSNASTFFLPTAPSSVDQPENSTRDSNVFTFANTEAPTALYVTPMSTETSSKVKYSSTYSLNSAGFRQAVAPTAASASKPMRSEVMDLLASIGLRPDNSSNVEDVYEKSKDILEKNARIPELAGIAKISASSGLSSVGKEAASIVGQNTFESAGSEIKKGVENLTPDVQLLFQRFGLETSNLDRPTASSVATTRKTTSNSYASFKPLPVSSVKDREMKEFLAKFGLGVDDSGRRAKSMEAAATKPRSLIEAVPNDMKGILRNIGLISGTGKAAKARKAGETVANSVEDMESTETSKFHVFKPHEGFVKDEEQRNKINELLDTVKLVQEGKADIGNAKKAANDLLESAKTLTDGPDPVRLEEIVNAYNEHARNEAKRQQQEQPPTSTVTASPSPATTESTATASSPTTTESTESAPSAATTIDSARAASDQSTPSSSNLVALEESFGGSTQQPDAALPPKRKSGLYFLVDWNSFLEVGVDDKEKINLRFQPKVGDRTRFLPVTVP